MLIDELLKECLALSEDVFVQVDELDLHLSDIRSTLSTHGIYTTIIDRAPIWNYESLMHAFYQNCEFPGWFGFNWNALKDSLCDFEWAPATGYVLIYQNPSLLKRADMEDWEKLASVLKSANGIWKTHGTPFKVIVPSV